MARSLATERTRDKTVAKGSTVGNCICVRYIALILMLIAPSWAWAEPEQMECSLIEAFDYELGKAHEKDESAADNKTYITIEDDVLAINYDDSGAEIFKRIKNRLFIKSYDYSVSTIVIEGSVCRFGDKKERKVAYVTTLDDGTYTEMLSCTCK
jgi:hypothetical protein